MAALRILVLATLGLMPFISSADYQSGDPVADIDHHPCLPEINVEVFPLPTVECDPEKELCSMASHRVPSSVRGREC